MIKSIFFNIFFFHYCFPGIKHNIISCSFFHNRSTKRRDKSHWTWLDVENLEFLTFLPPINLPIQNAFSSKTLRSTTMYKSSTQLCQKHHTHKSFSFTLPINLNTSYYRNYYINSYEMYTYLYLFIIIGNNYN